jgi:hypothetical protein
MPFHFFDAEQLPIPGSSAASVFYPFCEWTPDDAPDATVDEAHPMNRFVCSWLTSDVDDPERCQEILDAVADLEAGTCPQWFADGDAWCVNLTPEGVQFNASNIGPEDTAWWDQPEGRFSLAVVKDALLKWQAFLGSEA